MSRPLVVALLSAAALLVMTRASVAQKSAPQPLCATSGASVEFTIQGRGGGFEVPVSPKMVTLLHFPEPITGAFPPNQRDYSVNVMSRSVAILPLRDNSGVLNVDTKSFHVSVTLRPTAATDKAKAQVIFSSVSDEARFEAEVERRLAPLREELEGKTVERARRRVAGALLEQFAARAIDGTVARSDDNVILRVTRAITIGADLYVHLSVENRSDRPYFVAATRLVQARRELPAQAVFETPAEDPSLLGVVPRAKTGSGFLIVRAADLKVGQPLDVTLVDENKHDLAVAGVRVD